MEQAFLNEMMKWLYKKDSGSVMGASALTSFLLHFHLVLGRSKNLL